MWPNWSGLGCERGRAGAIPTNTFGRRGGDDISIAELGQARKHLGCGRIVSVRDHLKCTSPTFYATPDTGPDRFHWDRDSDRVGLPQLISYVDGGNGETSPIRTADNDR